MEGFVIVSDSREQRPFLFDGINPRPTVKRKALPTGDYSLCGLEDQVCIERKSLTDLFGSCGKGRKRFEAEMIRMSKFKYAAIVCEADLAAIIKSPPVHSKLKPKSLLASIFAWQQRFGVSFWPCTNRALAERVTYRLLERFYRDHQTGIYHAK